MCWILSDQMHSVAPTYTQSCQCSAGATCFSLAPASYIDMHRMMQRFAFEVLKCPKTVPETSASQFMELWLYKKPELKYVSVISGKSSWLRIAHAKLGWKRCRRC